MRNVFKLSAAVAAVVLLTGLMAPAAVQAQQMQPDEAAGLPAQQKPVMENVFFNVVWGSATGALTGAAISVVGSKDKTAPTNFRQSAFQGATLGGLIGVGVGLWLVYSGISFDDSATLFTGEVGQRRAVVRTVPVAPFSLQTSTQGGAAVTGFQARVLHLNF